MRIVSKYRQRSFLGYAVFEHAMVTTLLGVGVPAMLFFMITTGSRRNSDGAVDMLLFVFSKDGIPLMLGVAVGAVVLNLILLRIRNIPVVVSLALDDRERVVRVEVRQRSRRSLHEVELPFNEFRWRRYTTYPIPVVAGYKGYQLLRGNEVVGHLLTDHFTWDDQQQRLRSFLAELNERVCMEGVR